MTEHPIYSKVTVGELLQFFNAKCADAARLNDEMTAYFAAEQSENLMEYLKEYERQCQN